MNSESSEVYEKQRNCSLPRAGYSALMAVMMTVMAMVSRRSRVELAILLVQKCCKTNGKTTFFAPWSKTNIETNDKSTVSRVESQQRPRESPECLHIIPRESPESP